MFDPGTSPRIFGTAPGTDFADCLVQGLVARAADYSPADWARIEIYVNTTRMQRRLREVFDTGPARLCRAYGWSRISLRIPCRLTCHLRFLRSGGGWSCRNSWPNSSTPSPTSPRVQHFTIYRTVWRV